MKNNNAPHFITEQTLDFLFRNLENPELKNILETSYKEGEQLAKDKYKTGKYKLTITKEQAELIIDELTNKFIQVGLDENSEPNLIGLEIEKLIDQFNPYSD